MLLRDVSSLKNFYQYVVPHLKENECLLILLIARKKYYPQLHKSEEVLAREVLRDNSWSKFKRKVKRISNVKEIYFDRDGNEIPEEAFGVYVLLDPRDTIYAWIKFQEETNKLFYQAFKGDNSAIHQFKKLDIRWFSALHRSTSRKIYWLIDVDTKDKNLLNFLTNSLEDSVVWISETKNGYHLIVLRNSESARILFRERVVEKVTDIEVLKQPLTPIPGTLQGGNLVRPVKIEM